MLGLMWGRLNGFCISSTEEGEKFFTSSDVLDGSLEARVVLPPMKRADEGVSRKAYPTMIQA